MKIKDRAEWTVSQPTALYFGGHIRNAQGLFIVLLRSLSAVLSGLCDAGDH